MGEQVHWIAVYNWFELQLSMQSYDHRLHPTIVLVILNYANEIRVLHKQATKFGTSLSGF